MNSIQLMSTQVTLSWDTEMASIPTRPDIEMASQPLECQEETTTSLVKQVETLLPTITTPPMLTKQPTELSTVALEDTIKLQVEQRSTETQPKVQTNSVTSPARHSLTAKSEMSTLQLPPSRIKLP